MPVWAGGISISCLLGDVEIVNYCVKVARFSHAEPDPRASLQMTWYALDMNGEARSTSTEGSGICIQYCNFSRPQRKEMWKQLYILIIAPRDPQISPRVSVSAMLEPRRRS